jgi:hypothetical protein
MHASAFLTPTHTLTLSFVLTNGIALILSINLPYPILQRSTETELTEAEVRTDLKALQKGTAMPLVLSVEVRSATNLGAGPPDPYCTVALLDLANREVRNEKKRTTKKSKTANPVWNETLTFGKRYIAIAV